MLKITKAPRNKIGGAFFISAFFFSTLSLAAPQAQAATEPLSTFQITLMGWQNEFVQHRKSKFHVEDSEIKVPIKNPVFSGELISGLNLQGKHQDAGDSKANELIVFIPGTFGGIESIEIVRFAESIYQHGYSTLRLPNPLSMHYLNAKPNFPGLDFGKEGRIYADAIKHIQAEYHFTKVHFFGVSYGALVCAVIAHELGADLTGRVLLLSPPKNIQTSLTLIDGYFDELQDQSQLMPWDHLFESIRIRWNNFLEKPVYIDAKMAKSMLVLSGFHREFRRMVGKSWMEGFDPAKLKLRFIPYTREHNENFFSHPEKQDIFYWLKGLEGRYEIISSTDDFINDPKYVWPKDPHIHIYDKGGHFFGIMQRANFIDDAYKYF
jgi:pimeloyl-ACP methyl ester carboxylesterase